MISQADLTVISAVFGKTADEISGALTSTEEVSLGLRLNGKILTEEQQREARETAIKQGKEIGYKEIAKNTGIELSEGEKDAVIIAKKLTDSLSANYEQKYKNQTPSDEIIALAKKASDYEESNKRILETYKQKEAEAEEWKNKFSQKERERLSEAINNEVLSALPKEMSYDRGDALLIINHTFTFEQDEKGNDITKRDGKTILDALGNPEKRINVINAFVEEKKWIKQEGMGGEDRKKQSGLPKGMSAEEATKYLADHKIEPMSTEGQKMFIQLISK